MPIKDKLYTVRSDVPAITHLDYTARLQTVHRETNPLYWMLLNAFKEQTGCGVIVNTSFNVRGEPIVCTPEDAYRCFMRTDMDVLVVNRFVFRKENQPPWREERNWRQDLVLD
jgi:carbamoyltransferase